MNSPHEPTDWVTSLDASQKSPERDHAIHTPASSNWSAAGRTGDSVNVISTRVRHRSQHIPHQYSS